MLYFAQSHTASDQLFSGRDPLLPAPSGVCRRICNSGEPTKASNRKPPGSGRCILGATEDSPSECMASRQM